MSLKQTAVKPWKRSSTGSFGRSAGFWGLSAISILIVGMAAEIVASAIYQAGYMAEMLVDPLTWVISYVPLVLFSVAVLSFCLAALREIRYRHRDFSNSPTCVVNGCSNEKRDGDKYCQECRAWLDMPSPIPEEYE